MAAGCSYFSEKRIDDYIVFNYKVCSSKSRLNTLILIRWAILILFLTLRQLQIQALASSGC